MKKKNDKWGKKQVFIITANPYKQECVVILNGQFSDAVKLFKKLGSKNALANIKDIDKSQKEDEEAYIDDYEKHIGKAQLYTELPHGYVMVVSHCNSWIETVENIAHESLHLTHYVLRRAGVTLCKESEESYTYLQGHIMTKILEKVY